MFAKPCVQKDMSLRKYPGAATGDYVAAFVTKSMASLDIGQESGTPSPEAVSFETGAA